MKASAIKQFMGYLEDNGLRMTEQRNLILDAFLDKEGHFTAEEFYGYVKRLDSSVGQATIYRNLKHLVQADLARELDFAGGVVCYEHKFGHEHHDHLICTKCGERLEVYNAQIEKIQDKIAKEHGYKLSNHKLYLYGLCPECK